MDKQIELAFTNQYYRQGFIEEGLYFVLRLGDGVMLGEVEHNDRGGQVITYYQDLDTSVLREMRHALSGFLVLQKAEIHNELLVDK